MTTPIPWKRLLPALAVFVLSYAYFALFRDYGFQVEDEGTLLFQLSRAAAGQYPYVDFHTGYTPGFFAVGAALLQSVDFQVAAIRTALAVLNALTATGLYLLAAPIVGPIFGLSSPLAFVLFLPVWPGDFAAFNVPYPAWPATAAWIATALTMAAWMKRGGLPLLVLAGAVAGIAFGIKPNAGAFALAASTWIVAMGSRELTTLDRATSIAASVTMLLGVWFAFGLTVFSVDAAVHLPPCLALAALAAGTGRAKFATPRHPRATTAVTMLAAGFAVPTLTWAIPVLGRLGIDGFLRDVLLIGSGAADLYYLPHPPPELYSVVVTAAVLGIALVGRAIARGLVSPLPPFLLLVGGATGGVLALHLFSLAPEGFRLSVLWQLENAAFWLAPLANYGGVVLLARRLRTRGSATSTRHLGVLVPLAIAMYLQLYPRTDFMHLLMGVPLTFVLALALLRRVASWWSAGAWPEWTKGRHAVGAFAGLVFFLVFGLRLGADLEPLARIAVRYDVPREGIRSDRATLWVEGQSADDLLAFGKTAAWLRDRVTPGEPVLSFPAIAGLLFVTATTSPVPHDYWYPGRPSHEDEAAMLATLRAAPPRYVVTFNSGWNFFIRSPAYFADVRAFACDRYRLAARFGRFDILERRDLAPGPAASPAALAPTEPSAHGSLDGIVIETWQPTGGPDGVAVPEMSSRRQGVRRWLTGLEPSDVAAARLPDTRVEALLFLRGLRDAGDLRVTAWLLAGYRSPDPRLQNEAVSAMDKVAESYDAARHRWACDFDPATFVPFVTAFAAEARTLRDGADPRVQGFASAVLNVLDPASDPGPSFQ